MSWKALVILAVGVLSAAAAPVGDTAKKEQQKLEGSWMPVSLVLNGKEVPKENLKDLTLTFAGDKFTVKSGDKVFGQGTFKIDPGKDPRTIDTRWTEGDNKGKTEVGIYKVEGDTLTTCFAEAGTDKRPTSFTSKEDSKSELTVFKRAKP
jgi:uncharacterized protein (TIGR03067 family)